MSEKQYVVFKLGKEEYGIDIMNVSEIVPHQESIKVPNAPKFLSGIINFRGKVIPIIDLKKRFDLPDVDVDGNTRIIVINLNEKQVGFIVDEASQTISLDDKDVDPAPDLLSSIDRRYIIGVGKRDARLIILIDLEQVLTEKEKEEIHTMEV